MTSTTESHRIHPAAEMFPVMTDNEIKELAEDIARGGLREPVAMCEGMVLDGRNRLLACERAGVKPEFVEVSAGDSPADYVWSRNYARRHLTPSQRAMAATAMKEMKAGEARKRMSRGGSLAVRQGVEIIPQAEKGKARDKLAEMAQVNPRYVDDAQKIKDESPELAEEVLAGNLTIPKAKERLASGKKPQKKKPTGVKGPDMERFADRLSVTADPEGTGAECTQSPEFTGGLTRLLYELVALAGRWSDSGNLNQQFGAVLVRKGEELARIGRDLPNDETPNEEAA